MKIRELIQILEEIEQLTKVISVPYQKEEIVEESYGKLMELYYKYMTYEEENFIYKLIRDCKYPSIQEKFIHGNYTIDCMNIFDKIAKEVYAIPEDECFEKPVFYNDKTVKVFFDLYGKELVVRNPKKKTTFRAVYSNYKDFYERLLKDLSVEKLVEL